MHDLQLAPIPPRRYPTAKIAWRVGEGEAAPYRLTVVSSVTYALTPGRSFPTATQRPIRDPGDLAPFKPRRDVLVVGRTDAVARIAVGDVDKRAPIGAVRAAPIPPTTGTWTLPAGFDLAAFNVAPADQQDATALPEALALVVEPSWPGGPRVSTTLAPVIARAVLEAPGLMDVIALEVDTVTVDVDRMACTVVMRGTRVLPARPDEVTVNFSWSLDADGTSDARPSPAPALPFGEGERRRGTMEMTLPPRFDVAALPTYLRNAPSPPPPAPLPGLPFAAGIASARAASDDAAGVDVVAAPEPSLLEARRPSSPAPRPRATSLDLLWFDPARTGAIARSTSLGQTFADGLGKRALVSGPSDADESARRARGVMHVLMQERLTSLAELDPAFAAHERTEGTPPLVSVEGELVLSFDERSWMRVALAILAPSMKLDPELARVGDATRAIVDDPWSPTRVLAPARAHLRAAHDRQGRDGEGLDALVLRELIERRATKKRTILGEERIRGAISSGRGEGVPTYLSSAAGDLLPLHDRLDVRAVCELRRRQDALETHAYALVVVALARRDPV